MCNADDHINAVHRPRFRSSPPAQCQSTELRQPRSQQQAQRSILQQFGDHLSAGGLVMEGMTTRKRKGLMLGTGELVVSCYWSIDG